MFVSECLCQGQVLVELVMRAFGQEEETFTTLRVLFPPSNFYPAVMVNGPPQQHKLQKRFRLQTFQLYYWQKAINTGVLKIAHTIWKVKSVKKVWQWSKKIPIVETPLSNQILSMHRILSLKYVQTTAV